MFFKPSLSAKEVEPNTSDYLVDCQMFVHSIICLLYVSTQNSMFPKAKTPVPVKSGLSTSAGAKPAWWSFQRRCAFSTVLTVLAAGQSNLPCRTFGNTTNPDQWLADKRTP
jgi:hypothetical protein